MATPKFFKDVNTIQYAMSANHAGVSEYINIKDYFSNMVVRRDVFAKDTIYENYYISNGERPDQISYKLYGDEQYYWVILQINGITDYYNDWPLSYSECEDHIKKKYGGDKGAGEIHHYETVEVKNTDGIVLLPAGMVVPKDFIYYYYPDESSNVQLSVLPDEVTNSDYEKRLNQDKEQIQVLSKRYLSDYVREYKIYNQQSPDQKSEVDISEIF